MSSRLAARTATVCVLLVGIASARAERRPVAVIDLSGEAAARSLAIELGNLLVGHHGLRPIDDQSMIGEVTGTFDDENLIPLKTAADARLRAENQLDEYSFAAAWSDADSGQASLHGAIPTTQAVTLYADLVFQAARARLGENKDGEANELFTLVHRLSPGRRLDPGRYQQFVIRAFEASRFGQAGMGTLAVRGSGRIWIDGKDRGPHQGTPAGSHAGVFELEAGWHVVWLAGPERTTKGKRVRVEAGKEVVADIGDEPADDRTRLRRARLALKLAPDPTARASAIRRIAQLLHVRDAVLVTMANGRLIAQTWHDKVKGEPAELLPGFSAHRLAEPEKPLALLGPIATPRAEPVPDTGGTERPLPELPIYRRRSVQITAAVVAAAVIGSILIARAITSDTVPIDGDATFESRR